jgi:hypothetical protein
MAKETEIEIIGTEAQEGLGSPYIDVDSQELGQLFHAIFFNWIE